MKLAKLINRAHDRSFGLDTTHVSWCGDVDARQGTYDAFETPK
ncbi:MAG TPA: hypothetical protein VJR89_07870 [Polyangiales bacterium]|nr:hypothetical protein [Polyangiales bacterium]